MHVHSLMVLPGSLLYPSELSDLMLPDSVELTAHSQLSPLGLGLFYRGHLVSAASAVHRQQAACEMSRKGFGFRLEAQ